MRARTGHGVRAYHAAAMTRSLIVKVLAIALIASVALSAVTHVTAKYPSIAVERDGDGDFETVEGGTPFEWSVSAGYSWSAASNNHSVMQNPSGDLPVRLSSVTIVDLSGDELSRRVARHLMGVFMEEPEVQSIDVHEPGDPLESERLGELILVLEQIEADYEGLFDFDGRSARYRVTMGHSPEYGYDALAGARCVAEVSVDVDVESKTVGTPFHGIRALAESVADAIDVPELLDDLREEHGLTPPVPAFAIPEGVDLDAATQIAAATGLDAEPVLQGARFGRVGEAYWRYEGEDALDRLDRAVETLLAEGWTRLDGGNTGVDGRTHRAFLRRDRTTAEWVYEENRTKLLQEERWTSTNGGPQVHHVEGPLIPPVLWVHAWKSLSDDELLGLAKEAEQQGPDALEAVAANLTTGMRSRLEELGATALLELIEPESAD